MLADHIRAWPKQNLYARAEYAEWMLAATGTRAALSALSGLLNAPSADGRMPTVMQVLAENLGLTAADLLADGPDRLGLDEQGFRIFAFGVAPGGRRFRAHLGPDGAPLLIEVDADGWPVGKPRTTLPRVAARDDAEAAASAKQQFADFRKQASVIVKNERAQLESAMLTGQGWSVTLPHPVRMAEADRAAWRNALADLDLVQCIEQLDRATGTLLASGELEPPSGEIHSGALIGTLERDGWDRVDDADRPGLVSAMVRIFRRPGDPTTLGDVAAVEFSPGVLRGAIDTSEPQRLTAAYVLSISPDGGVADAPTPWADVDPVVVSELRRVLESL